MQALETAIEEIVKVLKSVDGLRQVPINPPETMNVETFAVVYPLSGSIDIGPVGTRKSLHVIAIDVLTVRIDLARDIARMKPFIDTVANALMKEVSTGGDMFTNSVETFSKLSYSWIATDYAGVSVVGYHFMMEDTKIQVNL